MNGQMVRDALKDHFYSPRRFTFRFLLQICSNRILCDKIITLTRIIRFISSPVPPSLAPTRTLRVSADEKL